MEEVQKGRVLIVEDDMLLSMVEERLIKRLGYEVVGKVTKGVDAIEKEEELNPDIIVMDISLKGDMDGIETMEIIRKKSDVSVIYLSGSGDRYSLERAKKTGFTDFLTKPVTGGDLKGPLNSAMNENDDQVLKSA
ncbi:response regulator [Aliifodinibius salipaludis]|uniref:Response regulator n=1 Tax=Fodinibius salipaludis TaxID=2032627 RepID=A0A2A2GEA7_9BACT|nr:response regulator [Aliifodinibius salipaludis]PAU95195.1 response regulator [Aliifodinibius salipaludis]